MRADICNPGDEIAVERFKLTLNLLSAEKIGKSWGLGVDVLDFQIGKDVLTVFADTCSIDIEGPEHLVRHVLQLFKRQGSSIA